MEIKDLELRVQKAEEKVSKCKKTIERHEQQLEKKIKNNAEEYEIKWKRNDIVGANKKLKDAEIILNNWKEKLAVEIEKERFLEGNAPQIIKDFLEDWKGKVFNHYVKRYDEYVKFVSDLNREVLQARIECIKSTPEYSRYLNEDGEVKDTSEYSLINVYPRKYMDEYLKERDLDYNALKKRRTEKSNHVISSMCEFRDETERLQWLEKELEKEKKVKMLDLIYRINKVVGTILDASRLRISVKGNLDGIITGEKGDAKVETVGAGGYNIQEYHYRTLVHKIK